jgi:hypothetical protein
MHPERGLPRLRRVTQTRRIATVAACCGIAAITPFIAGVSTAVLGLIPLAYAVWLVAQSQWPRSTQLLVSAVVVVATGALVIVFLILATVASGD